jgi:uncharacterized protein
MPTRDTAWPAGTPCWIDYSATDIDAAKEFYASVMGWSFTDGNPDLGGYLTCLRNDLGAAGMMPTMDPAQPSAWMTYFSSADSAATAKSINSGGGTVIAGPHEVADLGVMMVALDPQGVPFGSWESRSHTGVQIYNEPGSLVWNEAAMPDPDAARAFYADVFGLTFEPIPGMDDYATFTLGDGPLGGLGGHSPGSPQGWLVCFSVASTDDAVAAVTAGGGKVHTAPSDTPYGRFAVVADAWGAPFELMQAPADG